MQLHPAARLHTPVVALSTEICILQVMNAVKPWQRPHKNVWMVGGYTEDHKKPQNCQNLGVGPYMGMGACTGQYGTRQTSYTRTFEPHKHSGISAV